MNDDDVVKRLRTMVRRRGYMINAPDRRTVSDAADEITRLRAEAAGMDESYADCRRALAECEAERDRYHQLAVGEKQ